MKPKNKIVSFSCMSKELTLDPMLDTDKKERVKKFTLVFFFKNLKLYLVQNKYTISRENFTL